MATNESLKNSLQKKEENSKISNVEQSFNTIISTQLTAQFKTIKNLIPKHMTAERLCRIALNAISRNPKLMKCTPETIIGAVINCATVGLEPNLLGHAYIVPFYNSKTEKYEAQMQIGYKGALDLIRRTGQVSTISTHEVYEGDIFEFEYGLTEKLKHIPCGEDDESKITHFYACYRLKDGGTGFVVMSKQQIDAHRDKFTKSKDKNGNVYGTWVDHYVAMGLKTVILKLIKYMPISIEQQDTERTMEFLQRDNSISRIETPASNFGEAFIDTKYAVVDEETGEVKGGE